MGSQVRALLFPPPPGPVVQSVSTPACHAGGRRFESVPGRQTNEVSLGSPQYASVAQLVEQWTENPRVVGSTPTGGTICGCSSSGRAPPCQGGGSEFEPRHPLQNGSIRNALAFLIFSEFHMVTWPSGKAKVCKTFIPRFKSGRHLQINPECESIRDFYFLTIHFSLLTKSTFRIFGKVTGNGE